MSAAPATVVTPAEIWRTRVSDRRAVLHGEATVAVLWERDDGHWRPTSTRWELPA